MHTSFWSLGAHTLTGPVTWLVQGIDGSTAFQLPGEPVLNTDFQSGFLRAGWNWGQWRPALRWD